MTNTNKTKQDRSTNIIVATKVEKLANARVTWEEGAYKTSNDELYKLLNDCVNFYLEIRSKTKECRALNAWLKDRKIGYNDGTSLQTRIVRAVFGADCGKRAYTYARVITVAAAEKSPKTSMHEFVTKRGGIEEIRRTKSDGKSPTVAREENIEFAIDTLEKTDALTKPFTVAASKRELPEDSVHTLFVAIMRQESDGTYSMVFETSAKSVVNTALAQAGKEKGAAANAADVVKNKQKETSESDDAVADAIAAGELDEAA